MTMSPADNPVQVLLPEAPILVTGAAQYAVLTVDGELLQGPLSEARQHLQPDQPPVVCHMPATCRRAGTKPFPAFDLLELYAFVRPAQFCLPTPRGLADALGFDAPQHLEDMPLALFKAMQLLLAEAATDMEQTPDIRRLAWAMGRGGWQWTSFILSAIGAEEDDGLRANTSGLDAWKRLPEWEDRAPPPPPGAFPVMESEARLRLKDLLGGRSEDRPQQADYTGAVSKAFINPEFEGQSNFILAEAGTGVGKTLGYIAPASVWAEKNEAPVWLSTYTRNLQHQIDQELDRVFPAPEEKAERVVVRKGRENYLCLLNYEDAVKSAGLPGRVVALGLMARWIAHTRGGDLSGGDFPSWLSDLVGGAYTVGLSDRRGECIYTACSHYNRCFIEIGVRKSRRADLVVANHALVMVQAARGNLDLGGRTTRLVFDEGHHVFDAADSAFSAHLTAQEMWELRRWLRGHEGRSRGRARGLRARCEDLVGSEEAMKALDDLLRASTALVAENWRQRINDGRPQGPAEKFLHHLRSVILARAPGRDGPFGLEVPAVDLDEELLGLARNLEFALAEMEKPATRLQTLLMRRLDEEADSLDGAVRARIELVCRSLEHRCKQLVIAWREMLKSMHEDGPQPAFVDWLALDRADGRELDVGYLRHWVDPTVPFAQVVAEQAHGVVVTSATLTDGSGDLEKDWKAAEARTGASHLKYGALHTRVPSPFDYEKQTRVIVVNDVRKDDLAQVSAAYRELMLASNGGALGLFTAISRLRAVHQRIVEPLEDRELSLYAQHVDALNLPTLIDIFRAEQDACLLGTDAVRDGVDVPGDSLRMIVFDRVPWPRPTILHKARKEEFGKRGYDDSLTRLKLKQAFGRLVRRADDRGVFVMLDSMMPSRLAGAFPEGVEIQRIGLKDAVEQVREFFGTGDYPES